MLKEDKNVLAILIREYSMQDIMDALAEAAFERANEFSDMGFTDKSVDMIKKADLLRETRNVM